MALTQSDFKQLCYWAAEKTGVVLEDNRKFVIEARLEPLLERHGMRTLADLIKETCSVSEGTPLFDDCIQVITNQETSFFRVPKQYEFLKNRILPQLIEAGRSYRRLSIWSAASSTGQEVYSLAMIIHEHYPEILSWDLDLVATDISSAALASARAGEFSAFEVGRGLPDSYLRKYFVKRDDDLYVIRDDIRSMIRFENLNLAGEWPKAPAHHIVFMRNVLIYFDQATKNRIFERMKLRLHTDGILVLGGTEAAVDLDPEWEMVMSDDVIYYKLSEF